MIGLQLLTIVICGGLFAWGGYSWHNARRFIMPLILALTCLWLTKSWWALTVLGMSPIFCLGYGIKSPLRHVFGDGWGRGVWGALAALGASLGLFLTGHIAWYLFGGYLILNFTFENALKKINQIVGDCIIGIGFGLIIFIV